jgi:hypothetical protein
MTDDYLHFNGVDGETGEYLLPKRTPGELARVAQGCQWEGGHLKELQGRAATPEKTYGVAEHIDPLDLAQAGWGIVFASDDERTESVREALRPLLDHRKAQAARYHGEYYREYVGPDGVRPGESKGRFLARHGAGPGPADPENVPYYLLIVAAPEQVSYRFQYQVDVQYAVGRLHFQTIEEYARYAQSVVEFETGMVPVRSRAAFFGVQNPDDRATELSAEHLIKPLSETIANRFAEWEVETILGEAATKQRLGQLLSGPRPPSVLFTASHGIGFRNGHPSQLAHQGALLCHDWPGPRRWRGPIRPDHYFSGDDLDSQTPVAGLVTFHFACFSAGTPAADEFFRQTSQGRQTIAPHPFLAQLPQKLLGHPRGGALAVVGHVDRAWAYSFFWPQAGRHLKTFEGTLARLLKGQPVGYALEYFNQYYAELSSDLSEYLDDVDDGMPSNDFELVRLWTSNNDARSYILVGDPAVRLAERIPSQDAQAASGS